jgi:two-component system, NtrC family, sensor kinase
MTQRWLLLSIIAAVSLVAVVLLLDVQREFNAAIDNMKTEQATLATAVAADLETRLARLEELAPEGARTPLEAKLAELLGGAMKLEQPGSRILLLTRPERPTWLTTDGRELSSKTLNHALRGGQKGVVIPREEAPTLGMPPRIALAGVEQVDAPSGRWGVAVVASGQRLRARERYAQLRFLLSLGLVTAVVAGFGYMAIRQERRKLEVARELEVAALERDRERLLARADKMATLAALSSGIAHEVATPLGTITARVEQVLPGNAHDARATAALHVALEQVERIQSVIRGVLGLSRGEMPPLVPTAPASIAHGAAGLSLHRFEQAGVALELDLAQGLPQIACDPLMLEQALINLLINACDASDRGSIVRLTVQQSDALLVFTVEDEGEGISEETAARAQEPFFTTKPRGRGNGLGLAITREVVTHHGGKLRLAARADARGTQAVIELPHL